MKVRDLLQSMPVLQGLLARKMPAKVAYALAKNIKAANSEIEVFEQTRIKLLTDNWELNKETNKFDIPDEDQPRWNQMFDELADGEITFTPYLISVTQLDGVEMTPEEVMMISWMLAEEPERRPNGRGVVEKKP